MKNTLFIAVNLLFVLWSANALAAKSLDINTAYSCKDVPGFWEGVGIAKIGFVKCQYNGVGNITHHEGDNYFADIHFSRITGGPVCPNEAKMLLRGTCFHNHFEIHDYANGVHIDLEGEIEDHHAHLEGKMDSPKGTFVADVYQK